MAWIARGPDSSGYVQVPPNGQTPTVAAVASHRGSLWCLWSDFSGSLYYAEGNNTTFQTPLQFPDEGIPVLAELLGTLHAIIIRRSGEIAHYIFDDVDQFWVAQPPLNTASGFSTTTTPAFVAFHNKLFLVFIENSNLYYSTWTWNSRDNTAVWSTPQEVSGISKVMGIPAMFVLRGVLHVLCSSNDGSREILGFSYSSVEDIWNSCNDVSEGKAAVGVSATSYGDSAFLAFMENGPDDTSHVIYLSEFTNDEWKPKEAIGDQMSSDPPQLAVLNGRINCIFNTNDENKDLRWFSKSLLDYSLSTWMKDIPDETMMSAITVPGTHDSCAESNIPFVRTQYLSITKQMEAGLRFLDLRLRVHDDGQLYLYHGGIPINLPMYLKFDKVMSDVFAFMDKNGTPSEAVLVSINNDDNSGKQPPSVFYNAVQEHIDKHPRSADGQERWITSRTTATLGQARGKAILLRRYLPDSVLEPAARIGIDLSGWLNNNPDFTLRTPDGVVVTLQDKWQYSEIIPLAELIESKFGFVSNLLSKASEAPLDEWFLNFTSAVGDPVEKGEIAESRWIAVGAHSDIIGRFVPGMNIVTRREFKWDMRKRYGVIAMDYPELPKDSDLISWLIGTNF